MLMKYAVIGAAGQVGQEFAKCVRPEDVIPLTHEQLDITDPAAIAKRLGELKCDVVVNLAAFHNVNGCEDDPNKAFAVNAVGAGHVAEAARRLGCKVVYFSSDYVYGLDTDRQTPYLEHDAVEPLNVYGASKVGGEQLVRVATQDHLIVRSSSLFGVITSKKGWTFPEMILQRARSGEPLRVVDDQYMSPTYTLDLVRTTVALVQAGATGTVHVTGGGGCSWHEFATATLSAAGIDYVIEAVGSDAFPSKARRPSYSRLDSTRLEALKVSNMRPWQEGLRAYLMEKREIG